jgi:hypothetical protein
LGIYFRSRLDSDLPRLAIAPKTILPSLVATEQSKATVLGSGMPIESATERCLRLKVEAE